MPSEGTLLVVDDHEPTVSGLRDLLKGSFTVHATTRSEDAVRIACEHLPDAVLLDVNMPQISGIDVCAQLKQLKATRLIPILLMTGAPARDIRIHSLAIGADEVMTKPLDFDELRARLRGLVRMKRLTDELESADQLFLSLGRFIEARDATTEGHCERLAHYATGLGMSLGLEQNDLEILYRGAFLHDIGKIAIPDRVLLKKGRLTARESALMKCHPLVGDDLCATVRSLEAVRPIVRHHHERLDGRGYPDRLSGDAIPRLAQIVTVVDVYDALTSDRPYRKALTREAALSLMREEAGAGAYSLDLVEQFAATLLRTTRGEPAGQAPSSVSTWASGLILNEARSA